MHQATTKWLASYFDVLFAANRVLHPGEKRLVDFAEGECVDLPENFRTDIKTLLASVQGPERYVTEHMDLMVQRLNGVIADL